MEDIANHYEEAADFFMKIEEGEAQGMKNYEIAANHARTSGSFVRVIFY